MSLTKYFRKQIIDEILDIILLTYRIQVNEISAKYNISKQTVYGYLRTLVKEGVIEKKTVSVNNKKMTLYMIKKHRYISTFKADEIAEDVIWIKNIYPFLPKVEKNILDICAYGFTEMLNNAIDHAEAEKIIIDVQYSTKRIRFILYDNGIGIFKNIQQKLGLINISDSILELYKGKLTTDPSKHTGEGIFFTSRCFDEFNILSSELFYAHSDKGTNDYLWVNRNNRKGTAIFMTISFDNKKTLEEVFNNFTDSDTREFSKTCIPVKMMKQEGIELISRSQAKRLLSRFDSFKEIVLDFTDVTTIGQAFADEVFRVFVNQHPGIDITYINTNDTVLSMIKHVLNNNQGR